MRHALYEILEASKVTAELWDNGEYKPREIWVEDYCA